MEILWMRRILALHQLVYLGHFWADVPLWFSAGPAADRMMDPRVLFPPVVSPLHWLEHPAWAWLAWTGAMAGWAFLAADKLSKAGQLVLLALQLSLHHANPLIIHEPQQIANFLLVVSLLWPSRPDHPQVPGLRRIMVMILCSYYLVAGLKKLPDARWWEGDALRLLLGWGPLARQNPWVARLLELPWLLKVGTWSTLLFELSFPLIALTRWRQFLIPVALLFHALIASTLEVGTFGLIMAAFLCFLCPPRPLSNCLS